MEQALLKAQLTKGCGNSQCKNQYCFSSSNYKGGFYKDQDISEIYNKMGKLCLCPPNIQQIICRWSNFRAFDMIDAWSTKVEEITDEMLNSITRYQATQQTNFVLLVDILSCHLTTYDDIQYFLISKPGDMQRTVYINNFFIQLLLELEQDDLNIQRDNEIIELKGDVTVMIQKLLEILYSNCYFLTKELDSYTRKRLPSNQLITLLLYLPTQLMARSNISIIAISSMLFGYPGTKKETEFMEYYIDFVLVDRTTSIHDKLKQLIQGCNQYISVTLSLYDKPQKAVSVLDILKIKDEFLQVLKLMRLIHQQIIENYKVKTALTIEQTEDLLRELANHYINSTAYNITPDVDYWLQQHPYNLDVSTLPVQYQLIMCGQRRMRNFDTEMFSILDFPFLLNAGTKRQIFRYDISCNLPHVTKIAVTRDNIVNDAMHKVLDLCRNFDSEDAKAPLRVPMQVTFIGEEGIDAGGLSNEFFELICDQAFSKKYSLFTYYEDAQVYYFNKYPMLNHHELKMQYTFIGIIFGLAMANCVNIANELPDFIYKHILGIQLSMSDLKDIDEQLYGSLQYILDYDGDDMESILCATFSVDEQVYGETVTTDLITNGRNISVTQNNKQQYVDLRWKYEIFTSVKQQLDFFVHGFLMVAECASLKLFTSKELRLAVCGEAMLDFQALKENTTYEAPYSKDHRIVLWLWDILLNRFNDEDRRNFMKFTFGSSRAPAGGLSRQFFKVQKNGTDDKRLPTSHTCFGIMMLPEYSSKEVLEKQLRYAIINNEGFGLQ